ncbi:hypothetical protein BDZ85DRAFT_319868 [Elsinoe ampelina]|uniref:Nephrocystin 3-like N-terminal domain-containing protein n=1 Tax=Elsinoe ampelina TaxID=302913 RepID=A0A6A6GAN4_9PEZI|nr:hypothetical protein BDZ85DRAFT_319868 [Elsinoe ampelina]
MPPKRKRQHLDSSVEETSNVAQDIHDGVTNNAGIQHNHGGIFPGTVNNYHCSQTDTANLQDTMILENRQKCMNALKYDSFDSRVHDVKTALKSTCKWRLNRPEYRDWAGGGHNDSGPPFMWIKGKPASGKSTMMKFLYGEACKRGGCLAIPFFFNARGECMDRTTVGMYRSLLYQLLQKMPELQVALNDVHVPSTAKGAPAVWQLERLRNILRSALQRLQRERVVFCIDALDECDQSQVKEMLESFHDDLSVEDHEMLNLSVLFSSRHYPHIAVPDGIELVLEEQQEHNDDISRYIDRRLPSNGQEDEGRIKSLLLQRAEGVVLWVVLVIRIMQDEYDEGGFLSTQTRLERLKDVPLDLTQLFEHVLAQGHKRDPRLVLCVQWVLYSRRPLTVPELYWAIHSGIDLDSFDSEHCVQMTRMSIRPVMERYITSSSKGLLEQTRDFNKVVQFIHETVREFFMNYQLEHHGFGSLQTFAERSEPTIRQGCVEYLELWRRCRLPARYEIRDDFSDGESDMIDRLSYPLLRYVKEFEKEHCIAVRAQDFASASRYHDALEDMGLDALGLPYPAIFDWNRGTVSPLKTWSADTETAQSATTSVRAPRSTSEAYAHGSKQWKVT